MTSIWFLSTPNLSYLQDQRQSPGDSGKLQNSSAIHCYRCDGQKLNKPVTTGLSIVAAATVTDRLVILVIINSSLRIGLCYFYTARQNLKRTVGVVVVFR